MYSKENKNKYAVVMPRKRWEGRVTSCPLWLARSFLETGNIQPHVCSSIPCSVNSNPRKKQQAAPCPLVLRSCRAAAVVSTCDWVTQFWPGAAGCLFQWALCGIVPGLDGAGDLQDGLCHCPKGNWQRAGSTRSMSCLKVTCEGRWLSAGGWPCALCFRTGWKLVWWKFLWEKNLTHWLFLLKSCVSAKSQQDMEDSEGHLPAFLNKCALLVSPVPGLAAVRQPVAT